MKRIFVGFFIHHKIAEVTPGLSVAAAKFIESFCDWFAIDEVVQHNLYYYNDESGSALRHGGKISRSKLINILYNLIFSIFLPFYILYRKKNSIFFFYNLDLFNIIPILALLICRKKIYIISADVHQGISFNMLFKHVYRLVTGVIQLRSMDLNRNCFNFPGFYESDRNYQSGFSKNIIMSGSIGPETGLQQFLNLSNLLPSWRFHICGFPYGITENMIFRLASLHDNVIWYGPLKSDVYNELLEKCSFAVSFRSNNVDHNFNFPSKILEYLSHGKVVLSTKPYLDVLPEGILVTANDISEYMSNISEDRYIRQVEDNRFILRNLFSRDKSAKTFTNWLQRENVNQ